MSITHINPNLLYSAAERKKANIGELLVSMGKMSMDEVQRVLEWQQKSGSRFGEVAQKLGYVTETDVRHALAIQFDYAYLGSGQGDFSKELTAAYQPFSPQVEALRALRSQLNLHWFNRGHKLLAVVSANAGEGSSSLAANLAVVFSQLGERTLLVDANLREPAQQAIFNITQSRGLSDILIGRADLGVIAKIEELSGLHVLPAGTAPPNPQELLSRKSFNELIVRFREQYDVVIVDTPPASMNSDAQTVASRCGGALLVSRMHETRLSDLINVRDQLIVSDVQIVAAIVND
ncbi:MAG TPA: chain length determinant protein tyrosine kinase EpsG [Methylophilaceae bacterium]|jgi:chain length determinant protein tyrosine kinase EpsG